MLVMGAWGGSMGAASYAVSTDRYSAKGWAESTAFGAATNALTAGLATGLGAVSKAGAEAAARLPITARSSYALVPPIGGMGGLITYEATTPSSQWNSRDEFISIFTGGLGALPIDASELNH